MFCGEPLSKIAISGCPADSKQMSHVTAFEMKSLCFVQPGQRGKQPSNEGIDGL
jgi:hypothetical protein